jgi:DNA-binding CsgD family transcriptional regulator
MSTQWEALLEWVDRALARNVAQRLQHGRLNAIRGLAARLTPREAKVFALVVRGRLNKQIAHELGTTLRTIKAHRQALMAKLDQIPWPRPSRSPSGSACPPDRPCGHWSQGQYHPGRNVGDYIGAGQAI